MGGWGKICLLENRHTLKEETAFLCANIDTVIRMKDPELVGEFVQALHILGFGDEDPVIIRGHRYLLQTESKTFWAGKKPTFYKRYHSAYCGIIGLADFKPDKGRKMPVEWIEALERTLATPEEEEGAESDEGETHSRGTKN
eukprot:CAMPEP_0197538960 /NCGR_PEP_ID=MMETSP1318-20131121/61191_1 /TAXON_ID=552666 /ORGANISM="Partenskyella glossopodia, Strain RCC365" /LENGTH=141 /DNA_ID=CAMNT_0043097527 /DNA_START=143 /DNA_END=565 /DNA_ORIENTATION=-